MIGAELVESAARLGIRDALLLRRTGDAGSDWLLHGGVGAGDRWSGRMTAPDDEILSLVPAWQGAMHRFHRRESSHFLGAFYTRAGAVFRLREDVVMVVGNPRTGLSGDASDEALVWFAACLDGALGDPDPTRSQHDESRVEKAVQAIAADARTDVWSILSHAADIAARELECEVAIIRDGNGTVGATSTWGSIDVCDLTILGAALDELRSLAGEDEICLQNTGSHPLPDHLSWAQGTRSLLVVPIPGPVGGELVVAHTLRSPRGFSDLCRHIARQISDAVGVVGYAAMLRATQHEVADSHGLAA